MSTLKRWLLRGSERKSGCGRKVLDIGLENFLEEFIKEQNPIKSSIVI